MRHTHTPLHEDSIQGWQVLGELQLIVGIDPDTMVREWLVVIFNLLELRQDFVDRVVNSAQETVLRAMQPEIVGKSEHLHLLVLMQEYGV